MAIKKSVNATNIESAPISLLSGKRGELVTVIDKVALAATDIDNTNDQILFGPIPSNAKLVSVRLFNDDLDSNGTPTLAFDVGLYYSGIGSGQVALGKVSGDIIDVDCIATAITTCQSANVSGTELRFEAGDIVDITKEMWDLGGLSTDPGGLVYVGFDVTTAAATGAAGDMVVILQYII